MQPYESAPFPATIPMAGATRNVFARSRVIAGETYTEWLEFDQADAATGPGWQAIPCAPGFVVRTRLTRTFSGASASVTG